MAIYNEDDFASLFTEITEEVCKNVTNRAYDLLIKHINSDVYNTGINKQYEPSYQFRDKAWVKDHVVQALNKYVSSIVYTPENMDAPSQSNPWRHGYYSTEGTVDNRERLAEILNVVGEDEGFGHKRRNAFWDNFIKELNEKIGGWFYTEYNNKGIKIPAIKFLKADDTGFGL